MNPKPLIFISHITAEKEIAIAFQQLVEGSFLGMVDVFVSSDENSIRMGQNWLEVITLALKRCVIEIILCSPESVKRPWINFEAGAGWLRDIPVVPLCHSGMTPVGLPLPLNLLQAAEASQVPSLKLIFPLIAQAIGSAVPNTNFSEFVRQVQQFEERYTYWHSINSAASKIELHAPKLIKKLCEVGQLQVSLRESIFNKVEESIIFLTERGILKFQHHGTTSTIQGTSIEFVILRGARFEETITNSNFEMKGDKTIVPFTHLKPSDPFKMDK